MGFCGRYKGFLPIHTLAHTVKAVEGTLGLTRLLET